MNMRNGLWALALASTAWAWPLVSDGQVAGLPQHPFIRGDFNSDGQANVADGVGILTYLFGSSTQPPSCLQAGDIDSNLQVNIGDAVLLLAYLFNGGNPPSAPFPTCGLEPTGGVSPLGCNPSVAYCTPVILPTQFIWPMPGNDADEWVINNYVDLNPSGGITDYLGGSKSYDGHRGIDIDVPTFRAMDANFPIIAAAAGTVVGLEDSNFDRNMSCTGNWNFVKLEHADGTTSTYGHLKQNSVVVSMGQHVTAGTVLGVVGSSGCSTAPHLHFEVRDEDNQVVDPFLEDMFINPPVYNTPIGLMDATLRSGAISSANQIKDPPPNVTVISPGSTLGIGLSMGGGGPGSSILLRLRDPSNAVFASTTINFTQVYRHSFWWWNPVLPAGAAQGEWEVEILVNGALVREYDVFVGPVLTGFQQVRHGVSAASYQSTFDAMVANGYRPVWVDGSSYNGNTYYNVVFDQSNPGPWVAFHNLTSAQYQTQFTTWTNAGYRLTHIDCYPVGSSLRYAAIFVDQAFGPVWTASHGLTAAQFNSEFTTRSNQGYHPEVISVVDLNGTLYFTTLWEQGSVGSWYAYYGMTSAGYQTEFTNQSNAGRELRYVNAYTDDAGTGRYVAVWSSVGPSSWVGRHNLTSGGFQTEFDTWTGAGLSTRMVTAHETGGVFRYTGFWSN
ncbi:MAG: peptidoglycan DD-metalloendopeptidase family protein [Planctomycetota bacterium]